MASTKEYLDFVLEQLSGLDEISSRAMMGEYILYYRGKVFGGIMRLLERLSTDWLKRLLVLASKTGIKMVFGRITTFPIPL